MHRTAYPSIGDPSCNGRPTYCPPIRSIDRRGVLRRGLDDILPHGADATREVRFGTEVPKRRNGHSITLGQARGPGRRERGRWPATGSRGKGPRELGAGDALLPYGKRQTTGPGSFRIGRIVRRFHPWELTARRAGEDQRALQNGNGRRGLRSHPRPTGVGVGRIEGVRSDGSRGRVRCTAIGVEIPPRLGRVRDDKGGGCA